MINSSTIDDQELMKQIACDNLEAWAELVRRYSNLVFSIAYQVLKNNSDAEDATQDTFISLKKYANQYDASQNLRPWLSRVAANQAIRIYNIRKNNIQKESNWMKTQGVSEDSQKLDVASISEKKEVQIMVRNAIDTLPETSRVALTLYFGGELNQSEIAKVLGVSQFSISEKIKQGLEKVKIYLKKAGVHSSVIVSAELMKESLVSAKAPESLFLKLTHHVPTVSQTEALASSSKKIVVYASKGKTNLGFLFFMISLPIVLIGGLYMLSQKKSESTTNATQALSKENSSSNPGRLFSSIALTNILPFNIVPQVGGQGTTAALQIDGQNKWKVLKDSNGKDKLVRDVKEVGEKDGIIIPKAFTSATLLHGYIKLNSENTKFNISINSTTEKKSNQSQFTPADMADLIFGQTITFNVFTQKEIEFKLYVWPTDNKWEAVCFIYYNQKHLPEEDFYCWRVFTQQEFILSMYTDGNIELREFGFNDLGPSWNHQTEPELTEVLAKINEKPFLKK